MYCRKHPDDAITGVCQGTGELVCAVCTHTDHSQHRVARMWDVVVENKARLNDKVSMITELLQFCTKNSDAVPDATAKLHSQIDTEMDSLIASLTAQRARFHADVETRFQTVNDLVNQDAEKLKIEHEKLMTLSSALKGLSSDNLENLPVGTVGEMSRSKITYEHFLLVTDPVLHKPVDVHDKLAVELHVGDVEDSMRRMTWSTLSDGMRIYPPKGY